MIIQYIVEEKIKLLLFTCFCYRRIFKCHNKDCCKVNGKQTINMLKKGEFVKLKNFERKIKAPFMIYADLQVILRSRCDLQFY